MIQSVVLPIFGMSCQGCVTAVQSALLSVTGVHQVCVELNHHQATVQYDNTQLNYDELIMAIEQAGFETSNRLPPA